MTAAAWAVGWTATPAPAAGPQSQALVASARKALDRGDKDGALKLANEALAEDDKNLAAYAMRASVYDARREFDKAVADYAKIIEFFPGARTAYQRRGEDYFRLGKFKESVADFDKAVELEPAREPQHWQRGISLYYAGEYERGRKQFELHRTVNPDDVENAAWHYLCVARLSGADKARQSLIPVTGDRRVPMAQIQEMLAGKATPDDVLTAAKAGEPSPEELKDRLFYAHLYVGLYHDAAGRAEKAREHILLAAKKYAGDDYMGDVARVHATLLKGDAGSQPVEPSQRPKPK